MDLKDFPNTKAIPPKPLPDRKDMPDLDYKLLKEKKAQTIIHSCENCISFYIDRELPTCRKEAEVLDIHGADDFSEWLSNYYDDNQCELWEPSPREERAVEPIEAQTNINLVDRAAPSVDNDRKDIKDRKRHRVRFRNEPDGMREKEFEGLTEYHNVHRTDGEDRYNDPGDPRRGY